MTFFLPCVVVRVRMCYKKRTTTTTTRTTLSTTTAMITGGVRLKSHFACCDVSFFKFVIEARERVEDCKKFDLTKKKKKSRKRQRKEFSTHTL